jgi:predicted HicB family RNase H-like nuclease
MAIVQKPKKHLSNIESIAVEKAVSAFIEGAAPTKSQPQKTRKEPVLLRFEDETLRKIDQDAKRLGLSRAAWVRMVVAERLG